MIEEIVHRLSVMTFPGSQYFFLSLSSFGSSSLTAAASS